MSEISTAALKEERNRLYAQLLAARQQSAKLEDAVAKIDAVIHGLESDSASLPTPLVAVPRWSGIPAGASVSDAVKAVSLDMIDGITRRRVYNALRFFPQYSHIKENTVSGALASWAEEGVLGVVTAGKGRAPTYYTACPDPIFFTLSDDEMQKMRDPSWIRIPTYESYFKAMIERLPSENDGNEFGLPAKARMNIFLYVQAAGKSGRAEPLKLILGRHLPHLFRLVDVGSE